MKTNGRLKMRTYLRIINPIMAIVVLLLCLYAALFDSGFKPGGVLNGSVPTYFLAKGLFCSSALFILGRVLLLMVTKSEDRKD
jgi:hypothetical protein